MILLLPVLLIIYWNPITMVLLMTATWHVRGGCTRLAAQPAWRASVLLTRALFL